MSPKPRLTKSQALVVSELRNGGGLEHVGGIPSHPWVLWSEDGTQSRRIHAQTVLSLIERRMLRLSGKRAVLEAAHAHQDLPF